MNRIIIRKKLDALFGPTLAAVVKVMCSARARSADPRRRLLFIRPGGIGDAVLLIPAIREVKSNFPDLTIHVIAEKRNAEVFSFCREIEFVFRYDRPRDLLAAIRGPYDVVIDTEQWHRLSAVVARLTRAPMSVGFATNARKKLFSHPIEYLQEDYEVDSFLHLINVLKINALFDPDRPFLLVPEQMGTRALAHARSVPGRKVVALFPGGTIAERRWGGERFHAVAEQLSNRGCDIVVVGGAGDVQTGENVTRRIPNAVNLCGRLSLTESAALIGRSSLLITGDSGIMHLGYALGTKVLALFGPGIEKKWAPRSSRVTVINRRLPCSPCTTFGYTRKCPINAKCMKSITVEEVLDKAIALLEIV